VQRHYDTNVARRRRDRNNDVLEKELEEGEEHGCTRTRIDRQTLQGNVHPLWQARPQSRKLLAQPRKRKLSCKELRTESFGFRQE